MLLFERRDIRKVYNLFKKIKLMDLNEILESNPKAVVYVDTNKIKEVGTLSAKYLDRIKITPSVLEESLECNEIREDRKLFEMLNYISKESVGSLVQKVKNEIETIKLSNLIYGNSFFNRIASDSKNKATRLLEKNALNSKEDFLSFLFKTSFYFLTNTFSQAYKFAQNTSEKHSYGGLYGKITDFLGNLLIRPFTSVFSGYTKERLEKSHQDRIKTIQEEDDSFFVNSSNKKTRKWWKRKEKTSFTSRRPKVMRSLEKRLEQDLNEISLEVKFKQSDILDKIYNYTDIDLFTTAYVNANINKSEVILYTADKDFIEAGNKVLEITPKSQYKGKLSILYDNKIEKISSLIPIPENQPLLIDSLKSNLNNNLSKENFSGFQEREIFKKNLPYRPKILTMPLILEVPLYALTTFASGKVGYAAIKIIEATTKLGIDPEAPFSHAMLVSGAIAAIPVMTYYFLKSPEIVYHQVTEIKNKGIKKSVEEGIKYIKNFPRKIIPMYRLNREITGVL